MFSCPQRGARVLPSLGAQETRNAVAAHLPFLPSLVTVTICCDAMWYAFSSRARSVDDTRVRYAPKLCTNLKFSFPMIPVHMLPVAMPTPVFLSKRSFEDLRILSATRIAWRLLYSYEHPGVPNAYSKTSPEGQKWPNGVSWE